MTSLWNFIATAALSLGLIQPAHASVTWAFIETSLYSAQQNGGGYIEGAALPLPPYANAAATLTISDTDFFRHNLAYSYSDNGIHFGPLQSFGDTDFTFSIVADGSINMPAPSCIPGNCNHFVGNLLFTFDNQGHMSGTLTALGESESLQMNVGDNAVHQAFVAADSAPFGCFGQCLFDGRWALTSPLPVPEPSSIVLLVSAFGLCCAFGRKLLARPSDGAGVS